MLAFAGFSSLLAVALSVSSLLAPAFGTSHDSTKRNVHLRRSAALAVRAPGTLSKRFDNARFSFYVDGLGACGKHNAPGDFIVALNSAQYAGGSHCFETITISYGGKTASASIVDECLGCPFGALDLSEGLFTFFAPESEGYIYGKWNFGDSAAPPPPPPPPPPPEHTPTPKPTTSSTPPPPPPTTSKHTTSSHPPPPPSTTSTTPKPTSSTPTPTSTTPTTTLPNITDASVATAGPISDVTGSNLYDFNLAIVQVGIFLDQASHAQ